MIRARCLCGGVAYRVEGPLGPVTGCHCTQCRRYSGHYAASFDMAEVIWENRTTLREYRHGSGAVRSFCGVCGAKVGFVSADGEASWEAGLIDGATGTRMAGHIFVADKGDYYGIADGLPQHAGEEGVDG